MNACALIGCRPEKLPYGNDERAPRCEQLKQRLFCEILRMTREGVRIFLSGMEGGADVWAAETVLQIQTVKPSQHIELWAIVGSDRQAREWSETDLVRRQAILERASRVESACSDSDNGCTQKNRYMVDRATHLLAVYGGRTDETASAIRYARQKGLNITIIEP